MSVFRDESGRRGRAVRLASIVGAAVAIASLGVFLVTVLPRPLASAVPELAPQARVPVENKAREKAYRQEEARLKALVSQAEKAQKKRKPQDPREPVLAGFAVNWDAQSFTSLQQHADQMTHVMPEWIHLDQGSSFVVEDDAKLAAVAQRLEVTPTVSNYLGDGFQRALLVPLLATEESRAQAAKKLAQLCEERGWAGLNLDFEDLDGPLWARFAAFSEALWSELHPRGFGLSIDVPEDPKGIPAERLAAASDFLVVMAYDEHASTDDPGPVASPRFVATSAAAWLKRVPGDRLVIALGDYGYDWTVDADGDTARPGEEFSFAQALALARENEAPILWDPETRSPSFDYDDDETHEHHQVHFLDAPAVAAQLEAIAPLHVRGTALWRLGAEDPKVFDLFNTAPNPRTFDEERARSLLDGVIAAHDPEDVAQAGTGELLSLKAHPQSGQRTVIWDNEGHVSSVRYQSYPSGWIIQRQGNKPPHKVLLTFDDGPDPRWTPRILDYLDQQQIKATFLLIGENAQNRPDLVRRELAAGHVIGNHTYTHPDLARTSPMRMELELNVTEKLLEWITGRAPRLFRPPYHSDEALDDAQNAAVIGRAGQLGYLTLGQDIDPEDFAQHDANVIAQRVLAQADKGSVILLHDGGGDRSATLAALPQIVAGLQQKGITFATPEEMLGMTFDQVLPPAPRVASTAADSVVFGLFGTLGRWLGPLFAVAIALLALRAVLLAVFAPWQARRSRKHPLPPLSGQTVSVVVPGYNEESVIARTVQSLLEQEPPVLEVVCVDDGSKDRTLAVLHEHFDGNPRVRIFGKPNGGKASALNLGFAEARGDIVVALDSDTIFKPDTVARLVAPFNDARVGAVAGNAKVGNRVNRLTRWQALEYVTAQNLERRAWDLLAAVPVVPGAVGAWKRKAVLEAGGFHEDTLAEDTDLTLRLIADGYRVVYAEYALAYTEAPETAKGLLKQRFRWTYGVLQACWKHKGRLFRRKGGVIGWVILPAFAVYQFAVPFIAPAVDILLIVSLIRGQALATAGYYLLFFALDLLLSAVAVILEGEDLSLLAGLFVQRIAYRQILWLALAKSLWNAIAGAAVGWGKLVRTGTVQVGGALTVAGDDVPSPAVKIALAQIDTTVGAFEQNAARILAAARSAADQGAQLAVFPELTLCGYPPKDLLDLREFDDRCKAALDALARDPVFELIGALIGFPERHKGPGAGLWNAAALLHRGQIAQVARKCLLPTYDVFDEGRYFDAAPEPLLFDFAGARIGVTICEDLWNDKQFWREPRYLRDPAEELAARGAEALVNLSASPYAIGKPLVRRRMLGAAARRHGLAIAMCNAIGGNDSLIFDGRSLLVGADGEVLREAAAFREDLLVVDLPIARRPSAPPAKPAGANVITERTTEETPGALAVVAAYESDFHGEACADLVEALTLGIRDYALKTGFKTAVLGLSGGVDSALTAVLAARALGPENVTAIAMPSRYTASMSNEDAAMLAQRLAIHFTTIAIEPIFSAYLTALQPVFAGKKPDVAEENLQARIRGTLLMAFSNKHGALLITTGNKSELGTGFCTLYGDMAGGLAAIGDLSKTGVYAVCRHLNRSGSGEVIPARILDRPPTAELRENQTDQDSLPPYAELDEVLRGHIEEHLGSQALIGRGFSEALVKRVLKLVVASEYKRRQAAPALRVTARAFGEGWRFPIAHGYRH